LALMTTTPARAILSSCAVARLAIATTAATKVGRPQRETPGLVDVVDRGQAILHGWTSLAGSALYGSDAANGVVQVNTLSAADLGGHGCAEVRAGNDGTLAYELLAGFGAGRQISGVIGYSAFETDGNEYSSFDGSARLDDNGDLARFETRDRRSRRYLWAKLETGGGDDRPHRVTAQFHEQYWDFETGHGWLWWIPDFAESMDETRWLASFQWRPAVARDGRLGQEYVVRLQRHSIDWSPRYYPNGAFDGFYPAGMWEDLDTDADDILARAQLQWTISERADLLFGAEGDRFLYDGDREHTATVDVDDAAGGFPPFPGGATMALDPWLDPVLDHTRFENQIAYSAAKFNLSTNLYTTETSGLETELLVARRRLSGFANHSWARRDDEGVIDVTIAPSPDRVAWAPARVANAGAGWTTERWAAALTPHWQGRTARRASDQGVQTLPLHVVALNLDQFRARELVKVLPFPFDYRQETRRVVVSLRFDA
jgi:hypothetical protein